MSTRSFRQILVVAFGLSVSGIAFARQPPAVVKQQAAAAHAVKTSNGYRDINARFGAVPERGPYVTQADGGYRDMYTRF